jgi:hypothetical protein
MNCALRPIDFYLPERAGSFDRKGEGSFLVEVLCVCLLMFV